MATTSSTTSKAKVTSSESSGYDINMADFIKLLTSQLQNQNPLDPMDDGEFFTQLATLGEVSSMNQMKAASQAQFAESLLGSQVTGADDDGASVTGIATKLVLKDGAYYVSLAQGDGTAKKIKVSEVTSAIKNNTDSLSNAALLFGQYVSGVSYYDSDGNQTSKSTSVTGQVVGVSTEEGDVVLQVETTDGVVYPVSMANLSHALYASAVKTSSSSSSSSSSS